MYLFTSVGSAIDLRGPSHHCCQVPWSTEGHVLHGGGGGGGAAAAAAAAAARRRRRPATLKLVARGQFSSPVRCIAQRNDN